MELLELIDLSSLISGLAGALVGGLFMLWGKLGNYVEKTDNKIDDAIYKAVEDAFKKQVNQKPEE
jgi:hypothetical protein